jgi:hypothetical protein
MANAEAEATALTFYEKVIDFASEMAERTYGVEFTPATVDAWKQGNLLVFHIDKAIESKTFSSEEIVRDLIGLFSHSGSTDLPDSPSLSSPARAHAEALKSMISDEQAAVFLRKGLRILQVCEGWSGLKDPTEYARRAKLIGQMQATMFLQIVEPSVVSQPGFKEFTKFFRHASRLSTAIDAIADLKTDNEANLTSVEPTFKNRAAMATRMVPEMIEGAGKIGPVMTVEFLFRAARKVARDRKRSYFGASHRGSVTT